MEERKINEKESLELIAQMIRNTQQRFQKGNAAPFLVFGYLTVTLSLVIWYMLKITHNPYWNMLWLTIPVLGTFGLKLFFPNRKKIARTVVDKAVDDVWLVIGLCMILAGLTTFYTFFPIFFEEVLLMGIAVTLTGLIAKLKILTFSGILTMLSSVLFTLGIVKGIDQILLFGAIFFLFMVLPGHILYAKKEIDNV